MVATGPYNQNVANSPTNAYPVFTFRLANGGLIQGIVLSDSEGNEYGPLNPFPIGGTFSASLASASSSSERRVTAAAASTEVLPANGSRKGGRVRVAINSSESVNISLSGAADANSPLYGPGDIIPLADGAVKYVGAVYCYSAGGAGIVEYIEL
jgi:hypothetical protein